MHTEMTELAIKWYPALTELISKYHLEIKLDQFGYGKCIYYKGEEVGYFFEESNGIKLNFVVSYGSRVELHKSWETLIKSLEKSLGEVKL